MAAIPDWAPTPPSVAITRFTVLTVNIHKGFTALNRRFILPELREAVRSVGADMVFLQEIHGTHERHPLRYSDWPRSPRPLEKHTLRGDALLGQDRRHGAGTLLGQPLVGGGAAGSVGVADDQNSRLAVLALLGRERGGQLADLALTIGAQLRAAGGEHAFILHLGNDARFSRCRRAGVSAGDLLALQGLHLDIQVLFLGDPLQFLQTVLPQVTRHTTGRRAHTTADDRLFGIARDRIRQACTEQCTTGATDGRAVVFAGVVKRRTAAERHGASKQADFSGKGGIHLMGSGLHEKSRRPTANAEYAPTASSMNRPCTIVEWGK